jgi:hypothetical protein
MFPSSKTMYICIFTYTYTMYIFTKIKHAKKTIKYKYIHAFVVNIQVIMMNSRWYFCLSHVHHQGIDLRQAHHVVAVLGMANRQLTALHTHVSHASCVYIYTYMRVCVYIYECVCVWVKGTWRFHVYIHIYILYTFNISTQDILKSIQQPSQQLRIWI